ncbi:hypothetical protein GBAR_LOCUS14655, partial [Geodia barretti]
LVITISVVLILLIVLLKRQGKFLCQASFDYISIDSRKSVMWWRTLLMVSMFKAQLVIDWSQTTTWRTTHCMR